MLILDKPRKMPTELIRLKCIQYLIPTLVLDKPRKMPTELIRLKCVYNLIPNKVEMSLKSHSDA